MNKRSRRDLMDRANIIGIWINFGIVVVALIATPILAVTWKKHPFPGFLVEQTVVVSSNGNREWTGLAAGLNYPEKVIAIDNLEIDNQRDFSQFFAGAQIGQTIDIQVVNPDGSQASYSKLEIISFPNRDLLTLFWVPYFIGAIFFLGGVFVFRLSQFSLAGRAFSYFCANAALVMILLFDLWTTHRGTLIWSFAIAQIGGSLLGLAISFPEEVSPMKLVSKFRGGAYLISLMLASWSWYAIIIEPNAWAYTEPWRYSYIYGAIGIITLIIIMLFRMRTKLSPTGHEQVKIILLGSLMGFTPVAIWLIGSSFRLPMVFNPVVYLTSLLLFPLSIGVAIIRYRLWDLDLIIRRTIFYTIMTFILISFYLWMVVGIGGVVEKLTDLGELFSVLATFIIVAIFTPLRNSVQRFMDRSFFQRDEDFEEMINEFNETLRIAVNLDDVSDELVRVVEYTMKPEFISLWMLDSTTEQSSSSNSD